MKAQLGALALSALCLLTACEKHGAKVPAPAQQAQDPLARSANGPVVAQGFYAVYKALPPGGGIPDAEHRAVLLPYLTPALAGLLEDAGQAEDHYVAATKGKVPPLVEGDPFTSNFEGASSFEVGSCNNVGDGRKQCAISLTYEDPQNADRSKDPKWQDKLDLAKTERGWRVDDVEYGATWDFGNKGKLTDLLKDVISEGEKTTEQAP